MAGKSKRKSRKAGFMSGGVVVLAVLAIMGVQIVSLSQKLADKSAELESLQMQYEEETQRTSELEELQAYQQTDEYIEEMARSKLGLVYDDEIVFQESEEE